MDYEKTNPYGLDETLARIRAYLTRKRGPDCEGLKLLDQAVCRAKENEAYAAEMEEALLRGSTIQYRSLMSPFGQYFGPPRSEIPAYPHADGVNWIDTAMLHIKWGTDQE